MKKYTITVIMLLAVMGIPARAGVGPLALRVRLCEMPRSHYMYARARCSLAFSKACDVYILLYIVKRFIINRLCEIMERFNLMYCYPFSTYPLALHVCTCEMLVSFFKSDTNYDARLRRDLLPCVCNELIIKEL
jgi:hypothetical protein